MRNQIFPPMVAVRKKVVERSLKIPLERHEQKVFAQWLKLNKIPHYAIPNGGSRAFAKEGLSLKQQGVSPGVPDICIPVPTSDYHGLYVELKRVNGDNNHVSPEQVAWIRYLNSVGYHAEVAFGAKQAMQIVEDYLGDETLKKIRYNSLGGND